MSESIENITKSGSVFAPISVDHHLFQTRNLMATIWYKDISVPIKVINLYFSYTLAPQERHLNTDFTLNNCLFGSAKLIKNVDLDKSKYTGYAIGFDSCSEFLYTHESYGKKYHYFWSWHELICESW